MRNIPSTEELEDRSRFNKELTLSYSDIASFVLNRILNGSPVMIMTWIILIAATIMSVLFWPGLLFKLKEPHIFMGILTGTLLIPLLLVPLHEGLHLLPYRMAGARDIRFGMDMKQGIIYITAHRFVADARLFTIVALAPFIVITAGLIITIILCPVWWQWVLSLTLLTHTTMCAGDAAMITYTNSFKETEVFTWDDADLMEAYFYTPCS